MLKSKTGLYILLPLVVFIWGAIIYKVVDAFSAEEETVFNVAMVKPTSLKTLERETFEIGSVDRDPFLGTIYKPMVKKTAKKQTGRKKKDSLIWPGIKYQGLVKDKATGNAVYVIEVNGMAQLLKQKQSTGDITLIKGTKKTVTLSYKGKRKQFKILN